MLTLLVSDTDVSRADEEFLVRCDCKVCDNPQNCACQETSELLDEDGCVEFAYGVDVSCLFKVFVHGLMNIFA
jgi:hypothetical protein